ncbi:hypothetical protein [Mesorhizobium sp. M0130]|uniref:hypothetical protein n=1 Tax=Mesorhizobium sp. M0130 TaxID=2956887 RepID=UPI0003CE0A48|nr:hypothetical protein X759_34435 [Mesorhizobium sp. LSHC420B00]
MKPYSFPVASLEKPLFHHDLVRVGRQLANRTAAFPVIQGGMSSFAMRLTGDPFR